MEGVPLEHPLFLYPFACVAKKTAATRGAAVQGGLSPWVYAQDEDCRAICISALAGEDDNLPPKSYYLPNFRSRPIPQACDVRW